MKQTISIVLEQSLLDAIERLAIKEKRSRSNMIATMLRQSLWMPQFTTPIAEKIGTAPDA